MNQLEKYAKLLINSGLNVQKNQTVVINAPISLPEFVHLCTKYAYEAGAREVVVRWADDISRRLFFEHAADDVFDQVDNWAVEFQNHYAEIDACYLHISAKDPEVMKGIDQSRISRVNKAYAGPTKAASQRIMSNKNAWCVASMPTEAWAKKVFPDLDTKDAMESLWQAIISSTRANEEDPVKAWENHQKNLDQKLNFLNSTKFKSLTYKNSLGTNVVVGLPEKHLWYGGADTHIPKGYKFIANMPTEEVFTLPDKDHVNGRIVSSYPLVRNGVLIKDLWIELKDGKIIDFGASENYEALKEMINNDKGSNRLGEVALVPYDSPISNQNILFYNTLFDENASCHFAIGEAYPICIQGGENMSEEELGQSGANVSDTHVDFMVGTDDLEIIGTTYDGKTIQIFKHGNFVI